MNFCIERLELTGGIYLVFSKIKQKLCVRICTIQTQSLLISGIRIIETLQEQVRHHLLAFLLQDEV